MHQLSSLRGPTLYAIIMLLQHIETLGQHPRIFSAPSYWGMLIRVPGGHRRLHVGHHGLLNEDTHTHTASSTKRQKWDIGWYRQVSASSLKTSELIWTLNLGSLVDSLVGLSALLNKHVVANWGARTYALFELAVETPKVCIHLFPSIEISSLFRQTLHRNA